MKTLNRLAMCLVTAGVSAGVNAAEPVPASSPPAAIPLAARHAETLRNFGFLNAGKTEKAAFVGISASPASAALADQLKLQKGIGLVVDYVDPKSPAEQAGVKQYDVLQKLNDQLLINAHQFAVLVRTFKAGDEITLTLIRRGESQAVKVKLVERDVMPLDERNPWGMPPMPGVRIDQTNGLLEIPGVRRQMTTNGLLEIPGVQRQMTGGGFSAGGIPLVETRKWSDANGSLSSVRDGRTGIIILEEVGKDGKKKVHVLHNDEEIRALPPEVRERFEKMTKPMPAGSSGSGGGVIKIQPATQSSFFIAPGSGTPVEMNFRQIGGQHPDVH